MPRVPRPAPPSRTLVAILALAGLAAATPAAWAAWAPLPRAVDLAPDYIPATAAQVDALRRAKRELPADSPLRKIDSALQDRSAALARAFDPRRRVLTLEMSAAYSTPLVQVDDLGRLLVRIAGPGVESGLAELAGQGVEPVAVATGYGVIEAWVPYDRIAAVAERSWVHSVSVPGTPVTEIGSRLTEGDAIHRADLARAAFAIDGTGATVGVISDGVTNLLAAQATNDLPPAVQVGLVGSGDEGTAMLEIVHDLAPGAGLAFYGAGAGSAGMIAAQNWLVTTAGAQVVSDDIWMPREPYFQDGIVALNAAALVTGNDIVYITSAGNRAQRHIPQTFVDGGARNLGVLGASRPHVFGGADISADVRLRNPNGTGVRHTIVLQWGDPFGAALRDLDLYLVDGAFANIIALSTNAQGAGTDPVELIDFTYNGPDNALARIVVDYVGGLPAPVGMPIKIAANGPTFLEYGNPTGSINPHARHPLVYAMGAIDQADAGADTPEPFSSRGPADMLFPLAVGRNKPDAMAIDGVTVTGVGGFPSPFFGTSAASPHAAGLAALIRGVLPALTSEEVRDALSDNAIDLLAPGFDQGTGAGRLDALASLGALLNQPPVADAGPDTTVECTGPGGTPVTLNGLRSSDPDGDVITYAWTATGIDFDDPTSATPTASFPLGTTAVTLTVSDGQFSDDDEVLVTIEDTLPPTVVVTLDPASLWPPNHKLADIHATVVVSDVCDAALDVRLVSITSDEPDEGEGDGDAPDDIQDEVIGTADYDFRLRSERSGPQDGRTYTVCYEAEDGSGNVGTGCADVVVTHDVAAAAVFAPVSPGDDVLVAGGWVEFATEGAVPIEALVGAAPDLGGDAFARVTLEAPGGGSAPAGDESSALVESGTIRWYVPASALASALDGADAPTLYARLEHAGIGYLAAVPLPISPEAFTAFGAARTGGGEAASAAQPAAPALAATPAKLLLRAANPLPRGGALSFGVPAAGRVRVSLVAATGRRVAVLLDETCAPGWRTATVPATLDPGVYFAVAESARERSTLRVVVLR